jgi:virginiamycin A acetyltransferase
LNGPDPREKHPMKGFPQVCFIANTVQNPNIVIGDYTYYDDPDDPESFERNVLYHYPFIGDKLIIEITRHLEVIVSADVDALDACAADD